MKPRLVYILSSSALVLVALALRVWGRAWSLPYVDHPDEPAVVWGILRVVQGEPNPNHFFYPSLMFYVQAAAWKLHFWWGGLTGLYPPDFVASRSHHFYTSIPAAFVWGRVVTALFGTLAVAALAWWSPRLVGWRAAGLAAALLTVAPWAIIHSHYITVDGPAAATGLLALLAVVQLYRNGGRWPDYILAGVLAGIATGTKYQNVLVLGSIGIAHILLWRGAWLREAGRGVLAGGVAVLVFLTTTPFIILDFAGFQRDMEKLFNSYGGIANGDLNGPFPIVGYLRFLWREGLLPIPSLLLLAGLPVLLRKQTHLTLIILSFPLLLLLALLRMEVHFYRNLLPVQAPLLLLAAIGAVALWELLAPRLAAPARPLGAAAALTLILVPSTLQAGAAAARLAQPDSRVVAQEWARAHFAGVRIASELSHPLRWSGVAQATPQYFLPLNPPEWYVQQGYGLLLTQSLRRGGREAWTPDYTELLAQGQVVYTVGGRTSGYLGPRIDLITTPLSLDTLPVRSPQATFGGLRLHGIQLGRLQRNETTEERTSDTRLTAGDILAITAYWSVDAPVPPDDYSTFVHVRDATGTNVTQRDTAVWQGLFPPHQWQPQQVVVESLDLLIPDTLAPGSYTVVMGVYRSANGYRYPAQQGDARLPADELVLGVVVVE